MKKVNWTEPKWLDKKDHAQLKHIQKLVNAKKYKEAMEYATHECDTVIRDEVPADIWVKMGGELIHHNKEKFKLSESDKKLIKRFATFLNEEGLKSVNDNNNQNWEYNDNRIRRKKIFSTNDLLKRYESIM